jgi:hypothetical protein
VARAADLCSEQGTVHDAREIAMQAEIIDRGVEVTNCSTTVASEGGIARAHSRVDRLLGNRAFNKDW